MRPRSPPQYHTSSSKATPISVVPLPVRTISLRPHGPTEDYNVAVGFYIICHLHKEAERASYAFNDGWDLGQAFPGFGPLVPSIERKAHTDSEVKAK